MEGLLVGVTIVSLILALTMSVIAWTLWQGERQRGAARVEALAALAFSESENSRGNVEETTRVNASPTFPRVDRPAPIVDDEDAGDLDDGEAEPHHWDFALGGARMEKTDYDAPAPARRVALPDAMFHGASASGGTTRLWLALAAVALVVIAGVVTFKALHSPEIVAMVAASRSKTPVENVAGPHPLELLSLRHSTDADGAFTVTGLVQNPPDGQSLDQIEAVVYLFDNEGHYFASGKSPLEVPAVDPGDESPFVIKVATTAGVSRYRVGFRRGNGRVLAHIDRRGQLPGGTSGDAIDVEPALAMPADARRPAESGFAR